jgi:hypothetical protein
MKARSVGVTCARPPSTTRRSSNLIRRFLETAVLAARPFEQEVSKPHAASRAAKTVHGDCIGYEGSDEAERNRQDNRSRQQEKRDDEASVGLHALRAAPARLPYALRVCCVLSKNGISLAHTWIFSPRSEGGNEAEWYGNWAKSEGSVADL